MTGVTQLETKRIEILQWGAVYASYYANEITKLLVSEVSDDELHEAFGKHELSYFLILLCNKSKIDYKDKRKYQVICSARTTPIHEAILVQLQHKETV